MVVATETPRPQRRVLLLAPTERDAEIARAVLTASGLECLICADVPHLCAELHAGAGALLLAEEVCHPETLHPLSVALGAQPPWSDLPVLLLVQTAPDAEASPAIHAAIEALRNVVLLERPTRVATLLSLVRSAIRARDRQYQTREHLQQLERTGRALRELTVELAASNEELRDFAYVASHDLKEPLRGIASYAFMLQEDYGQLLDSAGRERLEALVRLPTRMFALLDSLLEYSRLGRLDLRRDPVGLEAVARSAIDSLRPWLAGRGAQVVVEPGLPVIAGDASLLERVFSNLITNGVKYNSSPAPRICIGSADGAVLVRDNGIGIPARHHETIFRMFKRLHPRDAFGGGTGAGLTIVRKIVERHGGKIWVESTRGPGTTFSLRFPAPPGERAHRQRGRECARASGT
jgi:signal transduction histidine kinase